MVKKKILMVTQVHPFPPHDGGRADIFRRLQALNELGYETELIAFYNPQFPPKNQVEQLPCSKVHAIPWFRRKLTKALQITPYSIACRENPSKIQDIIEDIQRRRHSFDCIIAESMHVLPTALRLKQQLPIASAVLRMHNNEPTFFRGLSQSSSWNSIEKYFFLAESIKYRLYEAQALRPCEFSAQLDHIAHISQEEYVDYSKRYPHIPQSFVPPAIDLKQLKPYVASTTKRVLFVGNLSAPNNIDGIDWFLRTVHPKITNKVPGYQFCIAGNTHGANSARLKAWFGRHSQVQFIDSPHSLAEIYQEACVFVNPMRFGAGVKLKTIDAVLHGVPIVTTPCGNQGTGMKQNQHLLTASTSDDFANSILSLLNHESQRNAIGLSSQSYLLAEYDQKRCLQRLFNTLSSPLNS